MTRDAGVGRKATTALAVLLAMTCIALASIGVRYARRPPPPDPAPIRLVLGAPADASLGSGEEPLDAALSTTGEEIAFVATREGQAQLWHRRLDDVRATALTGTEGAAMPAWKVGAPVIAFFSGGKLKAIHVPSGRISDLADAPAPGGATWLDDGSLLFVPAAGPVRRLQRGTVSDITHVSGQERGHVLPSTAGGTSFTYVSIRADGSRAVRLASRSDADAEGESNDVELTTTSGHGQLLGNYLLYASGEALVARAYSQEARALTGRTVAIVPTVGVTPTGRAMFAASGNLLVTAGPSQRQHEIVPIDADGRRERGLAEPGDYWQVSIAPRDRAVALTAVDAQLRARDVYLLPLAGTAHPQRITLSLDADSDPVWIDEGARLVFRSWQSGVPQLFSRRAAVSAEPDEVVKGSAPGDTPTDWRDGSLLVHSPGAATGLDVWLVGADGTRRQVTRGGFNETDARWSPDGRWIAYVSDESGTPDVYVQQWPEGIRIRASRGGGTQPQWAPDSRTIYFVRGSRIMRTRISGDGATAAAGTPEPFGDLGGRIRDLSVSQVSGRLLAIAPSGEQGSGTADILVNWRTVVNRLLLPAPVQETR